MDYKNIPTVKCFFYLAILTCFFFILEKHASTDEPVIFIFTVITNQNLEFWFSEYWFFECQFHESFITNSIFQMFQVWKFNISNPIGIPKSASFQPRLYHKLLNRILYDIHYATSMFVDLVCLSGTVYGVTYPLCIYHTAPWIQTGYFKPHTAPPLCSYIPGMPYTVPPLCSYTCGMPAIKTRPERTFYRYGKILNFSFRDFFIIDIWEIAFQKLTSGIVKFGTPTYKFSKNWLGF